MIGKIHIQNGNKIFACCDKELIDTKIKYGEAEIHISKQFYGTENLTKKELLENLSNCDCANVFGNKVCDLLLKEKIIEKEQIVYISKIAHTQIYKL